jgi:hypothetical protein
MSEYAQEDLSEMDSGAEIRPPTLDGPGNYVVEVRNIEVKRTLENGMAFFCNYRVLESDNKGSPVGSLRVYKVFDFLGEKHPKSKGLKMANVIGCLAACAGLDPSSDQKWSQLATKAAATNFFGADARKKDGTVLRAGRGVQLRVKTVAPRLSRSGQLFTEHFFSPAEIA